MSSYGIPQCISILPFIHYRKYLNRLIIFIYTKQDYIVANR